MANLIVLLLPWMGEVGVLVHLLSWAAIEMEGREGEWIHVAIFNVVSLPESPSMSWVAVQICLVNKYK